MRVRVLGMSEIDSRTILKSTRLLEKGADDIIFCRFRVENGVPVLGEEFFGDDCYERGNVGRAGESVDLGARGKSEKGQGSDGAVMLVLNGFLL